MTTFEQLGLSTSVLSAITEMGFETPTPIQEKSIPVFLETERDILGLAQTGTGKTAAFGLPILQKVDFTNKTTQALIICPTRELCLQISRDLGNYSKNLQNVNIVAVYGGSSITQQVDQLRRGAQIIVATPGRLMDLMERKAVKIQNVNYVVLDEADEMLNMGFRDDIEQILSVTPPEKRVCLFSATMSKPVRQIADRFLKDPVEITVGKKNAGNENIIHEYAMVHAKDKIPALKRVLDFTSDNFYGIIFCTTKNETQDISDKLIRDGYNADCLHGDLSQQQREKVMTRFRHHAIKILLATDVAARGIDVEGLTHVIHYHLPDDIEYYTHRSGRTARAGKTGVSFTLLNMREAYRLKEIEKLTGIKFNRILIPSATEVRDKKLLAFLQTIENTEIEDGIFDTNVMTALEELDNFTKVDLIKKVLSLELRRFSNEYLSGPDLNATASERGSRDGEGRTRERSEAYGGRGRGKRLFISIGSKDGLDNNTLKEFVASTSSVPFKSILAAEVKGVYSFLNVEDEHVDQLITAVNGSTYKDRPVRIEVSGDRPEGGGGGRREGGRGGYGGGRGGSERRSYGGGGERKSYGGGGDRRREGGSGERKSYGGGGEKRSYGGSSERKPYGASGSGERKPYGSSGTGERKPFAGGERKKRDGDFPPRKRRES
ncbi:MAG: DEAD/DEAH box helicase [Bacteroidota bacterium]